MKKDIEELCESLNEIANVYEYELDSKAQKVLAIACKKLEELDEQIESMKNCCNCSEWNWKHNKCEKKLKGDCFKNSKWKLYK